MIRHLFRSSFSYSCSSLSSSARPVRLVQNSHFSTLSNYPSPLRRQEYEFQNVPVSVWWDFKNCNMPDDVNVYKIAHRIREAVRSKGIKGPLQITAFGDVLQLPRANQEALSSTGINLTHILNGGKKSVARCLVVDLLCWVSLNPPPAHLFLIFGDEDFVDILQRLRMKNYNILLASSDTVPNILCSVASIMWHWNSLLKGEYLTGKHYWLPLEDSFSDGLQSTCSQIEEPELSDMKLTVSHSVEPQSSKLKQIDSHSKKPKLSKLKQTASHSKELGLSKPRQIVDHSGEAELFSSSSFWSYIECYFFSFRGNFLFPNTRSRKEMMLNFQALGPPILSSLSENDLLKVADLIISDKKWVVERPSQNFPFRDNPLDHFWEGLKLRRDLSGELELLSNSYFWSDMESFIFSTHGERIITQSSSREDMMFQFCEHDNLALAFFDKNDLLKVADLIISDKKWVVERPSQKFPFRLSSPSENPIPNDKDKDEQGNENASGIMTDKQECCRKGGNFTQTRTSSSSSSRWSKDEVEALVRLGANFDVECEGNRPKGPLWEEISCAMEKLGYDRSPKGCKEKWVKEMNKKKSWDSKMRSYFQHFDSLCSSEKPKRMEESVGSSKNQVCPQKKKKNQVKPEELLMPYDGRSRLEFRYH